jgi:hypothetical protein
MTRVTSIGYKKKNYIPSDTPAEHPYPNPEPVPSASKPAGGEVDPSAPRPIAKLPKSRRGTRGKKDKRGKKAGEGKEAGIAAAAAAGEEGEATSTAAPSATDATSTHTTTDEQPSSASAPVEGAEDKEEELVGKQDGERGPDGRKTMAGLKGPKPGETASEHAERMKKKEAQKMRREKGPSHPPPLLPPLLFLSLLCFISMLRVYMLWLGVCRLRDPNRRFREETTGPNRREGGFDDVFRLSREGPFCKGVSQQSRGWVGGRWRAEHDREGCR